MTTKERINWFDNLIYQERGVWYLQSGQRYQDGIIIHADGSVSGAVKDNPKADAKLKAKVKKYAELCASKLPLPQPDGGDCWHCCMITEEGQTLGDATKSDHIDQHIKEGYVVPSLVYKALQDHYNAPMAFYQAFEGTGWTQGRDFGQLAVKKAVYRYIMRRKGFAV